MPVLQRFEEVGRYIDLARLRFDALEESPASEYATDPGRNKGNKSEYPLHGGTKDPHEISPEQPGQMATISEQSNRLSATEPDWVS